MLPRRSFGSDPSLTGLLPHLPQFSNTKILVTNLGLVDAIVDRANSSNRITKKLLSHPNHGDGASRYHPRGRIRVAVGIRRYPASFPGMSWVTQRVLFFRCADRAAGCRLSAVVIGCPRLVSPASYQCEHGLTASALHSNLLHTM